MSSPSPVARGQAPVTSRKVESWPANGTRLRVGAVALMGVGLAMWGAQAWSMLAQTGLFAAVGFDFGMYLAQIEALRSGDPVAMYRLADLTKYHQVLAVYSRTVAPLPTSPVPYPPLFAWLMQPFGLLSPPLAFLVWTGVNLLSLAMLGWRVTQLVPKSKRWLLVPLLLVFPGVVPSLILGQPMLLLACAVAEFYVCLRSGRDVRAGLWLACLFIKPQYGILAGLLLIWKRRWGAVAGAVAGVTVILIGSVLAAGLPALLAYPSSLADATGFRNVLTNPIDMINWRSLVLLAQDLIPGIGDLLAILLVAVLSAATVALLCIGWLGAWDPNDRLFAAKFAALWMATLVANFHSHIFGLVLLIVPLAAALGTPGISRRTRAVLVVGMGIPAVFEPALLFVPALRHLPSWLLALALSISLASVVADTLAAHRTRARGRLPRPRYAAKAIGAS